MISDLDVTAPAVSVSAIYELPFGQGKPFLSGAGGIVQGLVGGWQIQGVYTYQTGFPVAFVERRVLQRRRHRDQGQDDPEVVQHRRLHVDPDGLVHQRDAGQPPAAGLVPAAVQRMFAGMPSTTSISRYSRTSVLRRDAVAVEGRVDQRLQRAVLPGPGRQPDVNRRSGRSRRRTRTTTRGARSLASSCSSKERSRRDTEALRRPRSFGWHLERRPGNVLVLRSSVVFYLPSSLLPFSVLDSRRPS